MLIFFIALFSLSTSYLELNIIRYPSAGSQIPWDNNTCPTQPLNPQFSEICYHKDISYVVELINEQQIYYMALDFTAPISWIKGPKCKVEKSKTNCNHIQKSFKAEIKEQLQKVGSKIKNIIHKQSTVFDKADETQQKITSGSIDKITGTLQKAKNIEFWTKDSGKLTSFYKLLLIGLFLSGQNSRISLLNTNFIKAQNISSHLDKISDGAISLRFDDQSEKSFLDQIFQFVGSKQNIVTIFLGRNATITIGDLSVKNAMDGYSGIQWLALDGKRFPDITQLTIENSGSEQIKSVQCNLQGVFSLSASYISIPQKQINELIKIWSDFANCKIGKNSFIECTKLKKKVDSSRKLILQFNQIKLSFELEELTKTSKGNTFVLNIRRSQTDNYIILGEPVFQKYFAAFDYSKNRIGIAQRRHTLTEKLISIVTLVRFLMFIFIFGCSFILCFKPCKSFLKTMKAYRQIGQISKSPQSKRLKYSNVEQENPYQDIKAKVQEVFNKEQQAI